MPRAEIHVLGSKAGYTTLAASRGVTAGERQALEELGFGGVSREGDMESLRRDPCMMGRQLPSGRWAISRLLPGGRDDFGRATVEVVTIILTPSEWAKGVLDLGRLASDHAAWASIRAHADRGMEVPAASVAQRVMQRPLANTVDALELAREAGGVAWIAGQPALIVATLHALTPADAMAVGWGIGLFAVPPSVELCSMRSGIVPSSGRPLVAIDPGATGARTALGARSIAAAASEDRIGRLAALRDVHLELERAPSGYGRMAARPVSSADAAQPSGREGSWTDRRLLWAGAAAIGLSMALLIVAITLRARGGTAGAPPAGTGAGAAAVATVLDTDGDGIDDAMDPDDDNDGMPDRLEVAQGTDPLVADTTTATEPAPTPTGLGLTAPSIKRPVEPVAPSPDAQSAPTGAGAPSAAQPGPAPVEPNPSSSTAPAGPAPRAAAPLGDKDGDGLPDGLERIKGTDPQRSDTDGDGVGDATDAFPTDPKRSIDTDGDGIDDSQDDDDDGDDLVDAAERIKGSDPLKPDTDGDGMDDLRDAFPVDPGRRLEDTDRDGLTNDSPGENDLDGDGLPNDKDPDRDGDGVNDVDEAVVPTEGRDAGVLPCDHTADCDGDGVRDDRDRFPIDPTEWDDADGDGFGDRAKDPDPADASKPDVVGYVWRVARALDSWRLDDGPEALDAFGRRDQQPKQSAASAKDRLVRALTALAERSAVYPFLPGFSTSDESPAAALKRLDAGLSSAADETVVTMERDMLRALCSLGSLWRESRASAKSDNDVNDAIVEGVRAQARLGEQHLSAVRECVRQLRLIDCDALIRGKDDPNRRLLRQELDRLRDELDRRARQKRESAR